MKQCKLTLLELDLMWNRQQAKTPSRGRQVRM